MTVLDALTTNLAAAQSARLMTNATTGKAAEASLTNEKTNNNLQGNEATRVQV